MGKELTIQEHIQHLTEVTETGLENLCDVLGELKTSLETLSNDISALIESSTN